MKKFVFIFFFLFTSHLVSETVITIGSGTSTTNVLPINAYFGYSYTQQIYLQSEINTAGQITAIRFFKSTTGTVSNSDQWVIYMGHTNKTQFANTTDWVPLSQLTEVFNGSVTFPNNGWMEITLSTPFSYNNSDNLVIAIDENQPGYNSSSIYWYSFSVSPNYRGIYYNSDGTNPNPASPPTALSRITSINQIQLVMQAGNMTYESSTTEQASTSPVLVGSTNQPVIRLKVVTSGSQNPFSVTSITFTTNGTTNTSDLTAAKVYYTTSPTFSTGNQFGSTIDNPSGTLTFTGTQQLATGNNYFWLAYDISSSATVNNVVDGTCTQFVTSDGPTTRTPDETNPSGSRTIKAPLSGTVNVGSGEEFTSLTGSGGLFEAINLLGLSGNLTALITSDLSETGDNALNQWNEIGGGGYYLTIQPSAATIRNITGNYAGGLIRLNGSDRVTIDGRYSSSGNYLSFTNNNNTSSAAVIWVYSQNASNPATNVTIRNCIVTGGGSSTLGGIIVSGSIMGEIAEADNTNVQILHNQVKKAQYGIAVVGINTGQTNGVVSNNQVGSNTLTDKISLVGMFISNQQNCTVENNAVKGVLSNSYNNNTSGITVAGESLNSILNANEIADIKNTNMGGWGASGIILGSTTNTTNLRVSNNVIYDIAGYGWSGNITDNGIGIRVTLGGGYNIDFNSVNLATNQTVAGQSAAIYIEGFGTGFNLRNNIFANQQTTGTRYAIYSAVSNTAFDTINFNDYFSTQHVGFLSSNQSTLSAWQTATGQDGSSIEDNPMFTGNTDLRPQSGSPVLNAGVPISGITTDFLGDPRNATTPSIGAYENQFIPSTPPNCPVLISPANASTGVSVQPTLQWSDGGGGTTGYKLYFGTNNPPTNIHNGTDLGNVTSYTLSSNLNYLTTYYWRIVSYNDNGDASGCEVRSFTTSSDPTVIPKFEQFNLSSFPAGWSQMYSGGVTSNRWKVNNTNYAGGTAYEMRAAYQFATGVSRLIVGPLNTTGITSLTLKFRHFYDDYSFGAVFKIQSSSDNNNWTDESYSFYSGGGDLGPAIITTTISNNLGAQTYIAWTIDGNHNQFDYWYIDDVQIYVTPSASNTQNIPGGNTNPTTFTGTGTTIQFITANTGAVDLSVERINSSPGGPLPSGLTNLGPVYWNIDVTSGTVNGTYSITFNVSGVPGVNNPSTLRLLKRNNPNEPWTDLGVPNNVNGTLLTWTGLTSFSEFGMGGGGDNPLPVQLASFVATTKGRDVILNWTTATEINTAGFEIERKLVSQEKAQAKWENVGFVRGNGNSNRPIEYTFTDMKLNTGKYAYRLKMIDNDGSYEYSDEVQVEIGKPDVTKIEQNYPNAFNPATKIEYQLANPSKVVIEVYNITGEKITELVNSEQVEGYYSLVFDASKYGLASGIYFYRMIAMDRVTGKNVVQTKKMLYLK